MKKSEIKFINQVAFFDMLEEALPPEIDFIHEVSSLLKLENDAIYRRKNGLTALKFEEAIKLSRRFNVSLNSVSGITDKHFIQCHYTPLNITNIEDYFVFIQNLLNNVESVRKTPEGKIILSAIDIPQFNFIAYNELTLFKLFSWNKSVYGLETNFESFAEKIKTTELLNYCEKIVSDYLLIPSTEIWTYGTMDTILRLLSYHIEMRHFSNKKTPLLICDQLLDLIDTLCKWAEKGIKGSKNTPFKFYVNDTELESTIVLFKKSKMTNCMIKLYSINGISTSDERFCKETEDWLRSTARRATLVSEASEKERFRFFDSEIRKIRHLIEKIQS